MNLFSLEGKTALLTGATRGIGQAIALGFAEAGADLILVVRDTSKPSETAEKVRALGRKVELIQCDLASKEQVAKVAEQAVKFGPIDILLNCGGIQRRHPAEIFPDSDWEEVIQVNMNTVFTLCRDIGKHMLETDRSARGRGKIINIASLVSFQGGLTVPAYSAAKHGVLGLTQSFANEWSPKGINVNGVAPGYIATDMNEALIANETRSRQIMERIPAGRWGSPEDFKGVCIFLASAASDYVCGETVVVDGGWMGR